MLDTSFTVCVESWPHNLMKSLFTMFILFSQYILPIIVLPGFYYNVRQDMVIIMMIITSLQMLKFLQNNQQSQEIERKKMKKLTLILTCLAVVFAVRSKTQMSFSKWI